MAKICCCFAPRRWVIARWKSLKPVLAIAVAIQRPTLEKVPHRSTSSPYQLMIPRPGKTHENPPSARGLPPTTGHLFRSTNLATLCTTLRKCCRCQTTTQQLVIKKWQHHTKSNHTHFQTLQLSPNICRLHIIIHHPTSPQ